MTLLIIIITFSFVASLFTWDYMDKKLCQAKNRINELEYQLNSYRQTCSGCGKEFYHACSDECLTLIKDEIPEEIKFV